MRFIFCLFLYALTFQAYSLDLQSGYGHSCANLGDDLACWGWNFHGQFGDGTRETSYGKPQSARLPAGKLTQYDSGTEHTCGIIDERLYCWGDNSYGQLGTGDFKKEPFPFLVELPGKVTKVSTGPHTTCAIVEGGVMCWGFNYSCEVGEKNCQGGEANGKRFIPIPQFVSAFPKGSGITDLSVGKRTVCVVQNSSAYCWGSYLTGGLGNGKSQARYTPTPVRIPVSNKVTKIEAGDRVSCLLLGGRVRCWGQNAFLGAGERGNPYSVSKPIGPSGMEWAKVSSLSVGGTHVCFVYKRNSYCFGSNAHGQLGQRSQTSWGNYPLRVNLSGVENVSAGGSHTCHVKNDRNIFCHGWNAFCAVGNGECGAPVFKPTRVQNL